MMKPDVDFFKHVLAKIGFQPENVIMIGDSYKNDMSIPISMGMKTVWVLSRPEEELANIVDVLNGKKEAPTMTVSSLNEID